MKNILLLSLVFSVLSAGASWYWPFGSDGEEEQVKVRMSELLEPASLLIDEASDLAIDGKSQEAVVRYRAALVELDRVERENPERADSVEFATVRNKRAYVNAAIDSLLMSQVQQNAKAVAVSDTTELEKRLAAEKASKKSDAKPAPTNVVGEAQAPAAKPADRKPADQPKAGEEVKSGAATAAKPAARNARERAMLDIEAGDYDAAMLVIEAMLIEKPNSAAALNLKARVESARGRLAEAEAALDQAIMSHPRSFQAYYNMAKLMLEKSPPNRTGARRYYETGRAVGGPEDPVLEEKFR